MREAKPGLAALACSAEAPPRRHCIARLRPHLASMGGHLSPRRCGLVSSGRAQYGSVVALSTNNLQADRESILGKPGRNAGGRLTGQVELIGEGDPLKRAGLLAFNRFWTLDALLERRARDRRRQQSISFSGLRTRSMGVALVLDPRQATDDRVS